MADVFLEWHQDFVPDSTGDLLMADDDNEVRQRLERRLFTAEKGYVWHQDYGAGLPQKVGSLLSVELIRAKVVSQLAIESSVATDPPAVIGVAALPGSNGDTVVISIQYMDAVTGKSVSFSISS